MHKTSTQEPNIYIQRYINIFCSKAVAILQTSLNIECDVFFNVIK